MKSKNIALKNKTAKFAVLFFIHLIIKYFKKYFGKRFYAVVTV